QTGKPRREFTNLAEPVTALAFNRDGKALGCTLGTATVRLWDVQTGKRVIDLEGTAAALDVKDSPDGCRSALVGEKNCIEIRQEGKVLHVLAGHKLGVTALAFSPDGRRLYSSGADACVRVWDTDKGKELRVISLPGPGGAIRLAVSPDGTRLAAA